MPVGRIAEVTFTSPDRVRDVLHNFNLDGFASLYPRYGGGRPPRFTPAQRRRIKQLALSHPTDHGLPFSTWSLRKLADFLVAAGVVDDISHEGLRALLDEHGLSFQHTKTWKRSGDPDYPHQRQLPQPDRAAVHRAALLRPGRHDHASHADQASMIRRYIAWRNRNAHDQRLQAIIDGAKVA